MRLGECGNYDRHISFDLLIMGDDARLNLGVCLVRQARLKEARDIFRRLLKGSRKKAVRTNLKAISGVLHRYGGGGTAGG